MDKPPHVPAESRAEPRHNAHHPPKGWHRSEVLGHVLEQGSWGGEGSAGQEHHHNPAALAVAQEEWARWRHTGVKGFANPAGACRGCQEGAYK